MTKELAGISLKSCDFSGQLEPLVEFGLDWNQGIKGTELWIEGENRTFHRGKVNAVKFISTRVSESGEREIAGFGILITNQNGSK